MEPTSLPTELTITLPMEDWNAIGAAIGELPHKVAAPIMTKITQQGMAQQTAKAVSVEASA